jgi:methyl-accepting chemotaxis protein
LKNKKKSLGFVLSVFFFSMLFVILTIAIAVFSSFTGQAFERSCRQDCIVALNGLSETLKDFSNSVQSAGNELSKNPDLISAVLEKNNYDMVSALKTDVLTHDLSYAFITDKSGKIIASSTSELDLQDLSNLHHVKQALDNGQKR